MDECVFRRHLAELNSVEEATRYVEIINCSEPSHNVREEDDMAQQDMLDFIYQTGISPKRQFPEGVKVIATLRLLAQHAVHPNTFSPQHISLPPSTFEAMLRGMRLPLQVAEVTAVVGPFFWFRIVKLGTDEVLQMILRKADVVKRGYSRGWELILSYSFQQAETAGFLKGTAHSKISEELEDLQACASQIHHPFLLPVLFLAHSMSTKNDISQRDARGWLRKIEHALSLRRPDRRPESEIDLGQVSHDLTECHAQVLFKPPAPYRKIVSRMIVAMECFWARLPEEKRDEKMSAVHGDLLSRLEFHGAKLDGTEAYGDVTRERLGIQRNAVQFVTAQAAQNDTRLNLDIANQQRRLAVITMRDSQAMKSLTLLGATFLPGTFVASIFSMTFFDFQEASSMSSHIWIYFAFALPLTTLVLFGWFWWDRRLESRLALEEAQLARKADTFESLRSVSIPM